MPVQVSIEPFVTSDSTRPAAKELAANAITNAPAVAPSATGAFSSRQGASPAALASAAASALTSTSKSAAAAVDNTLQAAMPAVRVESTGMMASIPLPQGCHIRYDSTDADSDLDGMPAQPATLQEATAQPPQSPACELNSIDQQEVLDAVADLAAPACTDASNVNSSVISSHGGDVSNAIIEDAMQGVLATTMVTPAASEQAAQASSILADLADAPPERETSTLGQSSTLHADSSADSELREAWSSEASHAQSFVDSVWPAATPDPLAGSMGVDLSGSSQPQQGCCSPLEAGPPLFRTFEELTSVQCFGALACVHLVSQ